MTKETKIGLLVGLAFIILFAIILSEKGATRGTLAPSGLTVADAPAKGTRVADAEKPLADAGRLPVESSLTSDAGDGSAVINGPPVPVTAANVKPPMGQPIPDEDAMLAPLPTSLVTRLNQPLDGEASPEAHLDSDDEATVSLEDAVAAALETEVSETRVADGASAAGTSDETPGRRVANSSVSRTAEATGAAGSLSASAGTEPQRPLVIRTVHMVQPGESLGKIAARYYGRATPARIEAIFNVNRDVLTSIHQVRATDELKIPVLKDSPPVVTVADRSLFEPASGFVAADVVASQRGRRDRTMRIPVPVGDEATGNVKTSKRQNVETPKRETQTPAKGATPSPQFQWYEVREKDTLSRIAKRELGDEKRFYDVYRMNRDIIENKDMIKPGLRIRLPVRESTPSDHTAVVASGGPADEP